MMKIKSALIAIILMGVLLFSLSSANAFDTISFCDEKKDVEHGYFSDNGSFLIQHNVKFDAVDILGLDVKILGNHTLYTQITLAGSPMLNKSSYYGASISFDLSGNTYSFTFSFGSVNLGSNDTIILISWDTANSSADVVFTNITTQVDGSKIYWEVHLPGTFPYDNFSTATKEDVTDLEVVSIYAYRENKADNYYTDTLDLSSCPQNSNTSGDQNNEDNSEETNSTSSSLPFEMIPSILGIGFMVLLSQVLLLIEKRQR